MYIETLNRLGDNQGTLTQFELIDKIDSLNKKANVVQLILREEEHFSLLQRLNDHNEREGNSPFQHFTDEMMMYYFIHVPKHIQEEYSKKKESKTEYIRDLMQFYTLLGQHADFIRKDIRNMTEDSLFKNLEKRHIREYHYWLKDKAVLKNGKIGYSMATMLKKVTIIKGFLKWLYEVEYITSPIHLGFLSNQLRRKDRPKRDLTYEETKAIINFYHFHPKNYALLTLLATTGSRCRELAMANWSDLYASGSNIYLHTDTKGDKERDVLILPIVFERLQNYRKRIRLPYQLDPEDHTPLIMTSNGKRYSTSDLTKYVKNMIQQTMLPFLKYKSGPITPHWFRHYFAQEALSSGADLYDIKNTLGHNDIRTTQIYVEGLVDKERNVGKFFMNKF